MLNNFIWLYVNNHISMELLLFGTAQVAEVAKSVEESENKDAKQLKFPATEEGKELSKVYEAHFGINLLLTDNNEEQS